ncbi:MAG: extracellular solute-binding protein [Chromatiales bacterium]|nr:extracellular solute-binding protein [Chromatiales bacterium]
MGQEGEQVKALLPEFERRHPGIRVRVQQIPWSAAHEKLLTAYAGDAMPDVFQLGNTWIPEFVALRRHRAAGRAAASLAEVALDDYFPGILATNRLDGRDLTPCPGTWIPGCSSTGRDLLAAAGFAEPPATWDDWLRRDGARSRRCARFGALRHPAADQRMAVAGDPRPCNVAPRLLRGPTTSTAISRDPRFRAGVRVLSESVRAGTGAAGGQHPDGQSLSGIRQRLLSRSTSPDRGTSASSAGGSPAAMQRILEHRAPLPEVRKGSAYAGLRRQPWRGW